LKYTKNLDLKKVLSFLIIVLTTAVFFSCSTTRKKKDVKGIKKLYHNTTARFNGYFNAEELMDKGMLSLKDMHVDNYNGLLEVYDYIVIDNPQSIKADMDKAIEKVSTVATIHDQSNFVDDCYLLIGKAQYLKQDYIAAEETFQYFEDVFDPKNPYGRAYDSSSRRKSSGRKSKKEVKQERKVKEKEKNDLRKEREKEKDEIKKQRDDARKVKDKEKKQTQKEREQGKKDRKKNSSKSRKSSKGKKSRDNREPRTTDKKEEPATQNIEVIKDVTAAVISKEDQKALDEAREAIMSDNAEEEKRRKKLEEEKAEQKKKEEDKYRNQGEGALFKNRSAYTEGLYWLGRTYIETERFSSAEFVFRTLEETPGLIDHIAMRIPAARAHLYLRTKEYKQALDALDLAIEQEKDRNSKARYAFIKAQLYERMNSNPLAYEEYKRAKKFSTDYELDFNANLNEIKLAYREGSLSRKKVFNKLDNMLAESKNDNYLDQIYFTLAQIKLGEGDKEGAIADFEEAISSSRGNKNVKLEAYFRLADLLFDSGLYTDAKANYDEVLKLMSKTDDRYRAVERLSDNLTDIASNIQMVELQDSLLKLSTLPDSELRDLAVKMIEDQREKGADDATLAGKDSRKSNIISSNRQLGAGRSNFFAYNPVALNQGKVEFSRTWGERVWEDNWRRSLRSDAGLTAEDYVEEVEEVEEEVSEDEIRQVLKDIPRKPTQIASAEKRIQNALFQLGVLFRERLRNYEKSVEVLSRLCNDYPEYERRDEALFHLYMSYLDLKQDSKAKSILAQMRQEYPDSKFTLLASDPSYAQTLKDKEDSIEKYYDRTFAHFENGEHQQVLDLIQEKDKIYKRSKTYAAKFALLNAISLGSVKGKKDYINALQQLVRSYPKTEEETRAKEILRFLKGDQDAFDDIIFDEDLDNFEDAADKLHYIFIVTYGLEQKTFDNTKVEVLNYNKKFHRFDNLKISNIYLNQQNGARIILVRSFDNKEKSMKYYEGVQKNKGLFIKDEAIGYDIFPVTQKNYREVIKQRGITNYRLFFEQKYLNGTED